MTFFQDRQSYKIYINDTVLCLAHSAKVGKITRKNPDALILPYRDKKKRLLNVIDNLEKSNERRTIAIITSDLPKLKKEFLSIYKPVLAAGGLTMDVNEKVLMIYRRATWDLPKGKLDAGETFAQAAVREVLEETGLASVTLGPFFRETLHTFSNRKGDRILKRTDWFEMTTTSSKLKLQAAEDIEGARWVSLSEAWTMQGPIHLSIEKLLKKFARSKGYRKNKARVVAS